MSHSIIAAALTLLCACDAIAPIPGGYPTAERLDHAAQLHVTRAALDFAEDNGEQVIRDILGAETLRFPVPPIQQTVVGVDVRVCPDGNCQIDADIKGISVSATEPSSLSLSLDLTLRGVNDAGEPAAYPLKLGPSLCVPLLGCAVSSTCRASLDTTRGDRDDVTVVATVALLADQNAARAGFTRLSIEEIAFHPDRGLQSADLEAGSCDGFLGGLFSGILGLLEGTIRDTVRDQLGGALAGSLEEQLCVKRGALGCPQGTFAVPNEDPSSVCRFENRRDAECVPTLLGLEGRTDLGSLVASVSPGTHGPVELLVAASGDARVEREGFSLSMFGGMRSLDPGFTVSPGHARCVPALAPPALATLPVLTTLVDAPEGVLIRAALSEAMLDQVGYAVFDSGLLCLEVGTEQVSLLSTSLVSLLAASLRDLTFPERDRPISLNLRPKSPPTFTVMVDRQPDDPLIYVDLEDLSIDFYTFRDERYARFMTYETHARIGLNLAVDGDQLKPELASIELLDSRVTHSETLREPPDEIALALDDLVGGLGPTLLRDLGGFDLPELFGIKLTVQDGTPLGIEERDARFVTLGLAARLADPAAPIAIDLSLRGLELHPQAMRLGSFGTAANVARVHIDAPPGRQLTFSHRLDGGPWSPYRSERELTLRDRTLLLQASHSLEVRAKDLRTGDIVGRAALPILVDALAPEVWLDDDGTTRRLRARDVLSRPGRLRVALDDAEPRPLPTSGLLLGPEVKTVRVWDEADNMTTLDLVDTPARSDSSVAPSADAPEAGGAAACTVGAPGSSSRGALAWLVAILVAWLASRRGARSLLAAAAAVLLACSSGGGRKQADVDPVDTPPSDDAGATPVAPPSTRDGGSEPPEAPAPDAGPGLPPPAPLSPGTLATYLQAQALSDGSLVLAGYTPGVPPDRLYGDLVVGRFAEDGSVSWEIVDGVPADAPVTADPSGFRGGIAAPGDDVGMWSSLALADDAWYVAYHDRTHGALKLATFHDGAWHVTTVADDGLDGTYASLTLVDGAPMIAFASVLPPAAMPGRPASALRVARASQALPRLPEHFSFEEIERAEIACRPEHCAEGSACLPSGECAAVTEGCTPRCKSDEACIAGACAAVAAPAAASIAEQVGTYSAWARTAAGLALVYFDALHGELKAVERGQTWSAPRVIDGRSVSGTSRGAYPSLVVDGEGAWHMAYADLDTHALCYAVARGDEITRTVVDDGLHRGALENDDGVHWVGADADLRLRDDGTVLIAYQDMTQHRALLARKTPAQDFAIEVLDATDAAGFWLQLVTRPEGDRLVELAYPHDLDRSPEVRVLPVE